MPTTVEKICVRCGKDVSAAKRTKDAAGRYYCNDCYAKASAAVGVERTPEQPPKVGTPAVAVSAVVRVEASLKTNDYERSPVLRLIRKMLAKVGWNPSLKQRQSHFWALAKWVVMTTFVAIALVIFMFGTWLIPRPSGQPNTLALVLVIFGVISVIGFIPASFGLLLRLIFLVFMTDRLRTKMASVVGILVLIGGLIFGWPKVSETWSMTGVKKPDIAYADLDSRFGFGTINKPSQFGKTSEQLKEEAAGLLNTGVSWKGVISDVRDGQILIQMRQTSMSNEVALIPGWWDEWRSSTLNRGDLIEFDGVLAGFGDPYPYEITHGTIRSAQPATADQLKSVLPQ